MEYTNRTQSFSSLYDKESRDRGTSLDLRPLQSSVSSNGLFYPDQEYANRNVDQKRFSNFSRSLQNIQMKDEDARRSRRKSGRSLLDLSNVTINDSEIDKVSA